MRRAHCSRVSLRFFDGEVLLQMCFDQSEFLARLGGCIQLEQLSMIDLKELWRSGGVWNHECVW